MQDEIKINALKQIEELIKANNISNEEISALFKENKQESQSILSKVFAYIGSTLILAGICYITSFFWEDIGSAGRIIISLGSGLICFIIALQSAKDFRYHNWYKVLFFLAVLLQPFGFAVAVDEMYGSLTNYHMPILLICIFISLQQFLAYKSVNYGRLLLYAIIFAYLAIIDLADWMEIPARYTMITIGISAIMIAMGLKKELEIDSWGFLIGSIMVMIGWFDIVKDTYFEISFIGVSALLIYISTLKRQNSMLYVSAFGMLGYIGYFSRNFIDSVGWPVFLIIMGIMFFAISRGVMKLKKNWA